MTDLDELERRLNQEDLLWPGSFVPANEQVLVLIQRVRQTEAHDADTTEELRLADEQYRLAAEHWKARVERLERVSDLGVCPSCFSKTGEGMLQDDSEQPSCDCDDPYHAALAELEKP